MFGHDELLVWRIFLSVYRTGSIQTTAEEMQLDSSTVSRKLSALEKKLGRKLFDRTKRPMENTLDAHDIYVYVQEMVYQREKIDRYYLEKQDDDSRILRVMVGNSLVKVAPSLVHRYSEMFPKLRFNMISPMNVEAFLMGKADVISVTSQISLPNCVLLPRRRFVCVPVASPEYIKKHGEIEHPSQLIDHQVFLNQFTDPYSFTFKFPLVKGGETTIFTAKQTVRYSNVMLTRQAVIEGHGIGISLSPMQCVDALEDGRLVPVLKGWHRPSLQNYVSVKNDDWRIKNIRQFASWWAEQLTVYEKDCEDRLVKLYGKDFLANLLSN